MQALDITFGRKSQQVLLLGRQRLPGKKKLIAIENYENIAGVTPVELRYFRILGRLGHIFFVAV